MPYLQIYGVDIPVKNETLQTPVREIGSIQQAFDGSFLRNRQSVKYDYAFETTPMIQSEAYCVDSLVRGLGHSISANTHLYSSTGKGPSSSTGCSIDTGTKKYGAASVAITDTNTLVYSSVFTEGGVGGGCTVLFWYSTGGAFTHYIQRRNAAGTGANWTSGGSQSAGSLAFVTIASNGSVTFTASGGTRYFDDIVILPYSIPDAWASQLYDHHAANAWGDLPRLTVTGTPNWSTTNRTMMGDVTSITALKAVVGGSFVTNARTLSISLLQV